MTTLIREKKGGKPKKETWFQDSFEDCMLPVANYLHAKMGRVGERGGGESTKWQTNKSVEKKRREER